MRVPLRLLVPVLLAAGAMASTVSATAVDNPVGAVTCLTGTLTSVTDVAADPAAVRLGPAAAPGMPCLAP